MKTQFLHNLFTSSAHEVRLINARLVLTNVSFY